MNGLLNRLVNQVGIGVAFDESIDVQADGVHQFNALWDTGATNSVVTAGVVAMCDLKETGRTRMSTANGEFDVPTYFVSIWLPNHFIVPNVRVALGALAGDIDLLIGMDIINRGDFAISNHEGKTSFTFRIPSMERVDYVRPTQYVRIAPKVGRNKPCPCGSGKKFKECHGKASEPYKPPI